MQIAAGVTRYHREPAAAKDNEPVDNSRRPSPSYPQFQQPPFPSVVSSAIIPGMDRGKQDELVGMLLKLRRDGTAVDGSGAAGSGTVVLGLSTKYGVAYHDFAGLRSYERKWLCCLAVAKSMRKAALAGRSAARIHGMWVIGDQTGAAERVELVLGAGRVPSKSQWPKGCTYLEQRGRKPTIVEHATVRVTDPLSTAFDIALHHGFREGLVAMDWILHHHTTREVVEAELERFGPTRNIDTLRKVVQHAIPNSMSPYESYARALLIDANMDGWVANAKVGEFFIDLLRRRLGIEIDGGVKYDGETYKPLDETLLAERNREKKIQNKGIILYRVSPEVLLRREEEFLAEVERLQVIADAMGPLPPDI